MTVEQPGEERGGEERSHKSQEKPWQKGSES